MEENSNSIFLKVSSKISSQFTSLKEFLQNKNSKDMINPLEFQNDIMSLGFNQQDVETLLVSLYEGKEIMSTGELNDKFQALLAKCSESSKQDANAVVPENLAANPHDNQTVKSSDAFSEKMKSEKEFSSNQLESKLSNQISDESLIKPSNFENFKMEANFSNKVEKKPKKVGFPLENKPLKDNSQSVKYSLLGNKVVKTKVSSSEEFIFPINRKPKEETPNNGNAQKFLFADNRINDRIERIKQTSILESIITNQEQSNKAKTKSNVFDSLNSKKDYHKNSRLSPDKKNELFPSKEDFFSSLFKKLGTQNKALGVLNDKVERIVKNPKADEKSILTYLNKNERKQELSKVPQPIITSANPLNYQRSPVNAEISNQQKNRPPLKHHFNENDPITVIIQKNLKEFKNRNNYNFHQNSDKHFKDLELKLDLLTKKKAGKSPFRFDQAHDTVGNKALELLKHINQEEEKEPNKLEERPDDCVNPSTEKFRDNASNPSVLSKNDQKEESLNKEKANETIRNQEVSKEEIQDPNKLINSNNPENHPQSEKINAISSEQAITKDQPNNNESITDKNPTQSVQSNAQVENTNKEEPNITAPANNLDANKQESIQQNKETINQPNTDISSPSDKESLTVVKGGESNSEVNNDEKNLVMDQKEGKVNQKEPESGDPQADRNEGKI